MQYTKGWPVTCVARSHSRLASAHKSPFNIQRHKPSKSSGTRKGLRVTAQLKHHIVGREVAAPHVSNLGATELSGRLHTLAMLSGGKQIFNGIGRAQSRPGRFGDKQSLLLLPEIEL
jgi:hypothetical protein